MQPLADIHPHCMDRALSLAARGGRRVMPNPCVGAVIAYKDSIIGEGYHERYGAAHAEAMAIHSVSNKELLARSTLYVTLEPCSHFGKTGPCADLIISSCIPRVVIGCRDPFPQVSGRGIQRLVDAGIEVIENLRHDECVLLNKRFILAHTQRRPYIILKWAQSSDGFLAPSDRTRVTISSQQSILLTHRWRGEEMAIAVGRTTAINDNPLLTVRHTDLFGPNELPVQNPTRVVIGEGSQLPHELAMFHAAGETIVFTNLKKPSLDFGPSVSVVKVHSSKALLPQICQYLYEKSIISILVEGGSETLQHFLAADLWDEARVCTAPITLDSGVAAPKLSLPPLSSIDSGGDILRSYYHPSLPLRLGLIEE